MSENNERIKASIPDAASPVTQKSSESKQCQKLPDSVLPPQTELGDYTVVSLLGTGGMGVVYKAYQRSLDRFVALKVLKGEYSDNPEYIRKFQSEAQSAARMRHPNIIQVYGIGEAKGIHYFVMEFVEGETLRQIIRQQRGSLLKSSRFLGLDYCISSIMQIAEGLKYAHDSGIIHRDIKPANIICDKRTQRMMIADFGLAKMINEKLSSLKDSSTGTPVYMAPELFLGQSPTVRSDIYSLGATFYEMLTGQHVYYEKDIKSLVEKIRNTPSEPVNKINSKVPPEISAVVKRCLEKLPEERYFTVDHFIQDMTCFLSRGRTNALENYNREDPESLVIVSSNKSSSMIFRVLILLLSTAFLVLAVKGIDLYRHKRLTSFRDNYCKRQIQLAKNYVGIARPDLALPILRAICDKYPGTPYAREARKMLSLYQKKE